MEKGDIHLTAYAAKDEQGSLWLTAINKDLSRDAKVELSLPDRYASAAAFRLEAPSAHSKQQVTLAGREVSADGAWAPGPAERVTAEGGKAAFLLPHASAVLLRLRP
jgi:hypothetical protein